MKDTPPGVTIKSTKRLPLTAIQPHPDNVNQGDIPAIAESLTHHSQYRAIVVSEATGNILAGNHTYLAAKTLGWKDILAHVLPELTAEQELRIMLADNAYAAKARLDDSGLSDLLASLNATPDRLIGTGYDIDDLDNLLSDLEQDRDRGDGHIPDPPVETSVLFGDRYQVGQHVVVCGDATDPAAYGDTFDLLWTDPPYGVDYVGKVEHLRSAGIGQSQTRHVQADALDATSIVALWLAALGAARSTAADDAALYVCAPSGDLLPHLMGTLNEAGWKYKHCLVWNKGQMVMGRADYHYSHEAVLYGWNKTHNWYGDRKQISVFDIHKPHSNDLHPTQKPIDLIEPMIRNSTKPGMLVCDPFAGSGSTAIAAHNLDRRSHTIEIDPRYVDVILQRLTDHDPALTVTKL